MIRFGYACNNMTLGKAGIRTGRTMIQRIFEKGGMPLASERSLLNAEDLLPILKWNLAHGIRLFRIGSEMFPRWNHYEIKDLPDYDRIREVLQEELSKKVKKSLDKKAEKRGLTKGSVYKEFEKGLAAYASSGSRKGMTAHQWAHARVNSANPSKKWAVVKKSKAKKKKK